jgi:hypothetical protein
METNEKIVTVDGHTLIYQQVRENGFDKVIFYQDYNINKSRKYILFGDIIEEKEPIVLFHIYANLNNVYKTKKWWYNEIRHHLHIVERKEEIQKGDIL